MTEAALYGSQSGGASSNPWNMNAGVTTHVHRDQRPRLCAACQ
jgi:hypothetical protein